ncbi:hypothetical protein [Ornithinimicrobium kibberense]|uniref:hypothetical protein n=1 Tax=Ornithinimicrobium kibberense TaxID=282060 RepID=UPI00361BAB33
MGGQARTRRPLCRWLSHAQSCEGQARPGAVQSHQQPRLRGLVDHRTVHRAEIHRAQQAWPAPAGRGDRRQFRRDLPRDDPRDHQGALPQAGEADLKEH